MSNNTDYNDTSWNELHNMASNKTTKFDINKFHRYYKEGYFCGPPDEEYMHIVVQAKNGNDLFNLKSLLILCKIEQEFMKRAYYNDSCIMTRLTRRCCRPWSLGNYVALLSKKPSCLMLTVSIPF